MPLSQPIRMRDGTMISALPLPKGTRVVTNIFACNRDTALWGPDAEVWRPERWLEPLPRAVEEAHVPGVYSHLYVLPLLCMQDAAHDGSPCSMTFIGGGRACM